MSRQFFQVLVQNVQIPQMTECTTPTFENQWVSVMLSSDYTGM
jgi:ABC-type arginine transport system permease subunit